METMIDNLINGNLTTAKEQAKKLPQNKIILYLRGLGWGVARSIAAAHYLKTGEGWQKYCDIEYQEKNE